MSSFDFNDTPEPDNRNIARNLAKKIYLQKQATRQLEL